MGAAASVLENTSKNETAAQFTPESPEQRKIGLKDFFMGRDKSTIASNETTAKSTPESLEPRKMGFKIFMGSDKSTAPNTGDSRRPALRDFFVKPDLPIGKSIHSDLQYRVSLKSAYGFKYLAELPEYFLLKISYESLDFINDSNSQPIVQFPFQNIICWGSSPTIFKFNVFDYESIDTGAGRREISFVLQTKDGKVIEENTMATVQKLMQDIEKKAVSREEFETLLSNIVRSDHTELQDDWFRTIDQFLMGRTLLAKQCMDLMLLISPLAPFERVEVACLLYSRILTQESFQLVVNTFEDKEERENVIHRLHSIKAVAKSKLPKLVTDCAILPHYPTSRKPQSIMQPTYSPTELQQPVSKEIKSFSNKHLFSEQAKPVGTPPNPNRKKEDTWADSECQEGITFDDELIVE